MCQKRSLSGAMLKEILQNDVHLDLLKIAKMTSDLEIKKIKREKEKSQVSKGSVYLNRLVDNLEKSRLCELLL